MVSRGKPLGWITLFAFFAAGCGRSIGDPCEQHDSCAGDQTLCIEGRCTNVSMEARATYRDILAATRAGGRNDPRWSTRSAADSPVFSFLARRCSVNNTPCFNPTTILDLRFRFHAQCADCLLSEARELLDDDTAQAVADEIEREDRVLLMLKLVMGSQRTRTVYSDGDQEAAQLVELDTGMVERLAQHNVSLLELSITACAPATVRAVLRRSDLTDWTSLVHAASCPDVEVVRALLDDGPMPTTLSLRDRFGLSQTPMQVAAQLGNVDVIGELARRGHAVDSDGATTPLMDAVEADQAGAIDALVSHGARVDLPYVEDAFYVAAGRRVTERDTAHVLLPSKPAAHQALLRHTRRAIMNAIAVRDVATVQRILAVSPDRIERTGDGAPLIAAVRAQSEPIVRILLDAGADPKDTDSDGWTALHHAADSEDSKVDIVKLLVERGAPVEAKTDDGRTAVEIARRLNLYNAGVVEFLRARMAGMASP